MSHSNKAYSSLEHTTVEFMFDLPEDHELVQGFEDQFDEQFGGEYATKNGDELEVYRVETRDPNVIANQIKSSFPKYYVDFREVE